MKSLFLLLLCLVPALAGATEYRVALILDKGGKDDKSFNTAAYAGATKAKNELGIKLKTVEATDDVAIDGMLRAFARKKFDLVIAIGFSMAEAVKKVAQTYPEVKFALVDSEVKLPNVRSLMFEEQEGSYLVGALAGLETKTGKVGFLGGMDIPLIRRFRMGFEAGLKKTNPKAVLETAYVGVTGEAWNNPAKAKELALAQYGDGADIIFGAAGASNYGLFDAAEDKKEFAIGVDSDQDWVKPGFVLTSMLKHVDVAVYDAIADGHAGKFTAGTKWFGITNHGIDYALDQYNDKLIPGDVRRKVDKIKVDIVAGRIVVPDYYKRK